MSRDRLRVPAWLLIGLYKSAPGTLERVNNLPDLALDLQAVFSRTYDEGPTETLDYAEPCTPPLSERDAEWALAQLKTNGYPR